MKRCRYLQLYVPGAADVPERIRAVTPHGVKGVVVDTTSALDWEDGLTAQYLVETATRHQKPYLARMVGHAAKIVTVSNNLEQRGCDMGPQTTSKIMALCANYGNSRFAFQLYERYQVKCGSHPSVDTAMSTVFGATGDRTGMRDLLKRMEASEATLSIHIFHAALHCFSHTRDEQAAFRVIQHLAKTNLVPDERTVMALLKCCRSYSSGRVVMDSIKEGKWGNIAVDFRIYNTLISTCRLHGDVNNALTVIQEMKDAGIPREASTYGSLAGVARASRNITEVSAAFKHMRDDGVAPDVAIYIIAIRAAADVLAESPKSEYLKWLKYAEAAFEQAHEEGVVEGHAIFTPLAACYATAGDIERMEKLKERLLKKHVMYNEFLHHMAACRRKTFNFSTMWAPIDSSQPFQYMADKAPPGVVKHPKPRMHDGDAPTKDWFIELSDNTGI
eukprot:TRINITY_DN11178_c0_g1_i1.p1 TRINITY_DN11178_c0_g1~~TRINITY_DN11178_c0_g1_i1.p1  ORF type:complete len:446 (+),score=58.82 TRINITY_DN11178_c0_g1_i1:912-2249(+)